MRGGGSIPDVEASVGSGKPEFVQICLDAYLGFNIMTDVSEYVPGYGTTNLSQGGVALNNVRQLAQSYVDKGIDARFSLLVMQEDSSNRPYAWQNLTASQVVQKLTPDTHAQHFYQKLLTTWAPGCQFARDKTNLDAVEIKGPLIEAMSKVISDALATGGKASAYFFSNGSFLPSDMMTEWIAHHKYYNTLEFWATNTLGDKPWYPHATAYS